MFPPAHTDEASSLVVIETSNNIYRHSAYSALTSQSVMCFARTAVANALAVDAPGWAKWFSVSRSGTYNNQWMVLDLNKFVKGQALANDTFWVLEEVPGLIHAEDQSSWLQEKRYWGSYNVAFYPETRKVAGEVQDHATCMRARLFASLQPGITSTESMQSVMAWNDYQNSSIAHSPSEAIMARGDLGIAARTGGGIDSKVASASNIAAGMVTLARAGPTNDDQPPFCWTGRFEHSSTPHVGHPVCFDFEWAPFKPSTGS
uniref:Phospholipase B-like n=1 Tax=Lotharella oceanica TaxID=641309 RepID=A0A7S2XB89_9EUKA|mmetsp:Transcript_25463/g.47513  ORF Transcript_25463/g.47513 Transcript_25463/m.47513 type:complete len:260 (+) Transcript_25463:5-784(+)